MTRTIFLSLFFVGFLFINTNADTIQANFKKVNGDWWNATNWEEGVIPNNSSFDVTIDIAGHTVTLSKSVTVNSVTLQASGAGSTTFIISNADLTANVISLSYTFVLLQQSNLIATGSNPTLTVGSYSSLNTTGTNCSITFPFTNNGGTLSFGWGAMISLLYVNSGEVYIVSSVVVNNLTFAGGILWVNPNTVLTTEYFIFNGGSLKGYGDGTVANQVFGTIINVLASFNWSGGDINYNLTVVSHQSAYLTTGYHEFNFGGGLHNIGHLWWIEGNMYSNYKQNYFTNDGTVTCFNNTDSGYFEGDIGDIGLIQNSGTIDCSQSPTGSTIITYWDVISQGVWNGYIDNTRGGGSWWINPKTVFNNKKLLLNGNTNTQYYVNTPLTLNTLNTVNGNMYLNADVSTSIFNSVGLIVYGMVNGTVLGVSNQLIFSGLTINNSTLQILPGANAYWTQGNMAILNNGILYNNGTWNITSTDYMTIDETSILVNFNEIAIGYTSSWFGIQGASSGSGNVYNLGLVSLYNQGTWFKVMNDISFYQCGNGTLQFYVTNANNPPYIDLGSHIHLGGVLRVTFSDQSIYSAVSSSSGLNVLQWYPPSTKSGYSIFNGRISSQVPSYSSLKICWSVATSTGEATFYKSGSSGYEDATCSHPFPLDDCPAKYRTGGSFIVIPSLLVSFVWLGVFVMFLV